MTQVYERIKLKMIRLLKVLPRLLRNQLREVQIRTDDAVPTLLRDNSKYEAENQILKGEVGETM